MDGEARDFRHALAVWHELAAYVHVSHLCALLFLSVRWPLASGPVATHGVGQVAQTLCSDHRAKI